MTIKRTGADYLSLYGVENFEDYCEFEYEGDNNVLEKFSHNWCNDWQIDRIMYDEYGRETDRTIEDSWTRY